MNQIKKIVLTGGPCAGKTTAMVKVIEHFSSLGYKVFTIPEVPTMFTQAGMNYLTSNKDFFFEARRLLSRLRSTWKTVSSAWLKHCSSRSSSSAIVVRWIFLPISLPISGTASSLKKVIQMPSFATAMMLCCIW